MHEGHVYAYYSDQRTFGSTNLRNNEPSEQWTFGTMDLRNTGKPPEFSMDILMSSCILFHSYCSGCNNSWWFTGWGSLFPIRLSMLSQICLMGDRLSHDRFWSRRTWQALTTFCWRYPISFMGKISCCGIHWPIDPLMLFKMKQAWWCHNPDFSKSTVKNAQSVRLCCRTCLSYNLLKSLKYIQCKWNKSYFKYWCRTFCHSTLVY